MYSFEQTWQVKLGEAVFIVRDPDLIPIWNQESFGGKLEPLFAGEEAVGSGTLACEEALGGKFERLLAGVEAAVFESVERRLSVASFC